MIRKKLTKVLTLMLTVLLAFSCASIANSGNIAVAQSKSTQAKKAYAKELEKMSEDVEFAIANLNKDSIPELIVYDGVYTGVFSYINGKIKQLCFFTGFDFIPSKNLIYGSVGKSSTYEEIYYKFNGKKVTRVAYKKGDIYTNAITGKKKKNVESDRFAPYRFEVKGKLTTEKKYKAYVKKLKGNAKPLNVKLVPNTAENRFKKLGYKTQLSRLKFGKTYDYYDITGNKKNDKLKIVYAKNDTANIFINGKKYNLKNETVFPDTKIEIIELKNGNTYIYINDSLYKYKKGKVVKVLNLAKNSQKYFVLSGECVTKVSGNTLTVEEYGNTTALGAAAQIFNYNYKNGKLVREKVGKIKYVVLEDKGASSKGIMKQTKKLYTSPSFKKVSGKIKAGEEAKALKIYLTKNKISVQLKTNSGKVGWVKCNTKHDKSKYLFKGCWYYGDY